MTLAHVAFGANCGDPATMYVRVAAALAARAEIAAVRRSRLVRSAPVGEGTATYLNGCYELESSAAPRALFEALRQVEAEFGRTDKGGWAPRTVDLDLVLHGDHLAEEPDFVLPHPRMHFRRFVLAPLAELRPDARHPLLGLSAAELLGRLNEHAVAWIGGAWAPSWPIHRAEWHGRALRHGGHIIGGHADGRHPLLALVADPAPPLAAGAAKPAWTPVVDCRGPTPAAVARQLAFLRQSLASVEPWPTA